MVKKFFILSALLTCFGCTSNMVLNSTLLEKAVLFANGNEPLPAYIGEITYSLPSNYYVLNAKLCIVLNQAELWEMGDTADKLFQHLSSNTLLSIDGKVVAQKDIHFSSFGMEYSVLDKKGNVIGTQGGPLTVCITPELEYGIHLAKLQIVTTTENVKSYSWFFNFE